MGAEDVGDLTRILRERFGYNELRPGQKVVVNAVMAGRDTLAVMPTGGGKSLCYQLPALCLPGITVVVSPLIALMRDQVEALRARSIEAAAVNSTLGPEEYRQVMQQLRAGKLSILYVAPERFASEGFMRQLEECKVSLMAVDEAHCLSQWGHDFRPEYLRLEHVRTQLGAPPVVALTATATQAVREDIIEALHLRDPLVIVSGFARPNLSFRISHCDGRQQKFERIRAVVRKWKKGIIYCSTRKNVMTVFGELSMLGVNVVAYHAGMSDEEREFSQNVFTSGRADVVVATNAFGMGIDRSDVRFVLHYEIPGSVEAYYQEAGRAGRDGAPASCELLFNHVDLKTQEFFYEGSNPSPRLIRALYDLLVRQCSLSPAGEVQLRADEMAELMGRDVNAMGVSTALSVLLHAGVIARTEAPGRNVKTTRVLTPELSFDSLPIDCERIREKARRDHRRIEDITRYAYSNTCRQMWIMDYFGETGSAPCGHCDVCCASSPEDARLLSADELCSVRKALAGVARACRRNPDGSLRPCYGRSKIMDMLRGAKKATLNDHLRGLSTYGILAGMSDAGLRALFRAMQKAGLVEVSGGEMPLISLTTAGESVMRSAERQLTMSVHGWADQVAPDAAQRKKRPSRREMEVYLAENRQKHLLYKDLKAARLELARRMHLPPYRVASDAVLRALAEAKPTTAEGAARIRGIGAWSRMNALPAFVEVIRAHVEE